jgi:hypothetical protein
VEHAAVALAAMTRLAKILHEEVCIVVGEEMNSSFRSKNEQAIWVMFCTRKLKYVLGWDKVQAPAVLYL